MAFDRLRHVESASPPARHWGSCVRRKVGSSERVNTSIPCKPCQGAGAMRWSAERSKPQEQIATTCKPANDDRDSDRPAGLLIGAPKDVTVAGELATRSGDDSAYHAAESIDSMPVLSFRRGHTFSMSGLSRILSLNPLRKV